MFDNNDSQQVTAPQPDSSLDQPQNDQMTAQPTTDTGAGDYMLEDGTPASAPAPAPSVIAPSTDAPAAPNTDELLDIKRQALQQLSPLVGHLEQSPEEKFRTTMMMIQAADDDSLIKQAYEAAQAISDEKTRAQALLDVVNEINYFTQAHNDNNN